jgi:preprotein translocase subunit SecF
MRHALIFNAISALTFVAAGVLPVHQGLHLSVEFTGGTVMEVAYSRPPTWRRSASPSKDWVTRHPGAKHWHLQDVMIRLPAQQGVNASQQSEQVTAA